MSSKSSHGEEVKDERSSYSKNEATAEPMETSSIDFSSIGKRKAENSDPEEDSERESEDDDSSDSSEGGLVYRKSELDSVPDWDVDSYDGREYHSDEKADLRWRRFKRQLFETRGFFADPEDFPRCFYCGVAPVIDMDGPYYDGLSFREFCAKLAIVCLEKFNQEKGSNVKFVDVLWVNKNVVSRRVFFITFLAKEFESPNAPLVEYQAKVMHTFDRETYPILCRPSPNPKWMREKLKLMELTKAAKTNEAEESDED